MKTLLSLLFAIVAILSIVFAILNIIIASITKRVFKALVNFTWLIISAITGVCSMLFFKDFVMPLSGSASLAQVNYIFTAINNGVLIALITLVGFVLLDIILLIFIIKTLKRLFRAIKKAAIKTKDSINNTANMTKEKINSVFTKNQVIDEPIVQVNETLESLNSNNPDDSNLQN